MLEPQLVPPRPIDPLLLITRDSPLLSRDTSTSLSFACKQLIANQQENHSKTPTHPPTLFRPMYVSHFPPVSSSSAVGKHHDGPGPSGLGGWGRHTFTPSMPLPSPSGYPNGGGGGGGQGGFGPPPGHHGHPHHQSFGGNGMHIGNQNGGGMGMGHGQGGGFGMGMFGGGSPPRNGGDGQMLMTPLWQQQIAKADVSVYFCFSNAY